LLEIIVEPGSETEPHVRRDRRLVERDYANGFHSDLDTELVPKGRAEDVVRLISAKKDEPDWLLE
jgi:hypothetical protein